MQVAITGMLKVAPHGCTAKYGKIVFLLTDLRTNDYQASSASSGTFIWCTSSEASKQDIMLLSTELEPTERSRSRGEYFVRGPALQY